MQTYDLLMLLVLVAATLFGFWKGMAWQLASLASLVLSYFAALRFSTQLAPVFGEHAPWNRFVAMLVIYIATSFAIWTLFRLVSKIIDRVKLEGFDRQLGALLGFGKGVLLCVAITFFSVTLLPPAQGEAIVASRAGRYIVVLLDKTHTVVPPEIHEVIDPYLHRIEDRLRPGAQPQGQDLQGLWPSQASAPPAASGGGGWALPWSQPSQPQSQPQQSQPSPAWPTQDQPPAAWPAQSQASPPASSLPASAQRDPYAVPREPQQFPGPY